MLSRSTKLRIGCMAVALIWAVQPVAAKGGLHKRRHVQGIRIWSSVSGNAARSQSPGASWRYDEAESAPAGH
jgi:hypothetical protein